MILTIGIELFSMPFDMLGFSSRVDLVLLI